MDIEILPDTPDRIEYVGLHYTPWKVLELWKSTLTDTEYLYDGKNWAIKL